MLITGALTVLLMGLTLWLAAGVVPGVQIDGLAWAFVAAIVIAAVNTVLTAILGLDEDESFYRNSLRKLARVRGDVDDRPGPGFVIAPGRWARRAHPQERAAHRLMPFLSALVRDGSHTAGQLGGPGAIHDQRRPDRHPARQQRGHPRIPLVGDATGNT